MYKSTTHDLPGHLCYTGLCFIAHIWEILARTKFPGWRVPLKHCLEHLKGSYWHAICNHTIHTPEATQRKLTTFSMWTCYSKWYLQQYILHYYLMWSTLLASYISWSLCIPDWLGQVYLAICGHKCLAILRDLSANLSLSEAVLNPCLVPSEYTYPLAIRHKIIIPLWGIRGIA